MTPARDTANFERLIGALAPWLDQIVIVGGWAHHLYRLHPSGQALDYVPLSTLDTDIAMPRRLTGEEDIRERLIGQGFVETPLGDSRPPATHYHLANDDSGFYAEFLTPLTGSQLDRQQRPKATIRIGGVVSQQLRHIDLLLQHPWSIHMKAGGMQVPVRIANPVSYMAQKILIHGKRHRGGRAKDILYLHDTLDVFGSRLKELRDLWQHTLSPQLKRREAHTISRVADALFVRVTDDIRRATAISIERGLSPSGIQESCHYGLHRIFGSTEL